MLMPILYEVVHHRFHFCQAFPRWGSFQKPLTRVLDEHHQQFAIWVLDDETI
jgi:hypothetical protein